MALPQPSRTLAERMLSEVGFEDHLLGFRVRERSGPVPMKLYSCEELLGFLSDPFPQLDFAALQRWLATTMGDDELAQRIGELAAAPLTGQQRTHQLRDLLAERLLQCRRVAGHR